MIRRSKPERRLIKRVTSTQLVQAERKCMNGMKVLPGAANDTMLDLTCLMTYTEKVVYGILRRAVTFDVLDI